MRMTRSASRLRTLVGAGTAVVVTSQSNSGNGRGVPTCDGQPPPNSLHPEEKLNTSGQPPGRPPNKPDPNPALIAGALAAAIVASQTIGTREEPQKRGPKTDPDAPHNKKIREEAQTLIDEGNTIIAGGVEKRFSSRRREVTNLAGVRIFCTGRRMEK
jgi:hypothetical protein